MKTQQKRAVAVPRENSMVDAQKEVSVPEALVMAGVAYARRDYEQAENATLHVLGQLRKERQQEVRTYAE